MRFIIYIGSCMYALHRNVGYAFVFIVFLLCGGALYGRGTNDNENNLAENEFVLDSVYIDFQDPQPTPRPSLPYLTEVAMAKKMLQARDFLDALRRYVDLQSKYGNVPDIAFGLGEVYYQLADLVNAQQYYSMVLNTDDDEDEGGFTENEIIVYYRNANIYFQDGDTDKYVEALQYIIGVSAPIDASIVAQARTQSMDRIVALYKRELDYSYIARRELGVYLAYTENIISDEALAHLLGALTMAVHGVTDYLQTQEVGYAYTDLYYMIELLKKTNEGRRYLESFYLSRIFIALRKYYDSKEGDQAKKMSYHSTQLLELLGYFESADLFNVHAYSPILR